MLTFYQAVLESLHRCSITACFGELSVKLKNELLRLIQPAWKIVGVKEHMSMHIIYEWATLRQAGNDMSHVLPGASELLPSGRRSSLLLNRCKKSFILVSTKLIVKPQNYFYSTNKFLLNWK